MQKIITNKIKCKFCGDIIESTHHYDFKSCSCEACSVDGGHDYREYFAHCPADDTYVSGDYRSEYCQNLFKEADVVVTNPPFSLFRDFVATLEKYKLKYALIGNQNAITYKEIFPLIKDNNLWLGAKGKQTRQTFFSIPEYYPLTKSALKEIKRKFDEDYLETHRMTCVTGVCWFTNIEHDKRHENLILVKKYDSNSYPKYDNYDAIEVNNVKDIPEDYDGVMGVPITFLYQYNPDQFEIVGMSASWDKTNAMKLLKTSTEHRHGPILNKKKLYMRIFIRRKAGN